MGMQTSKRHPKTSKRQARIGEDRQAREREEKIFFYTMGRQSSMRQRKNTKSVYLP
jgi:hypothetical protein